MVVIVGSLVVVVRELDVRVVVVDEGEIGVDEGQCVEHGKDPFSVPRLKNGSVVNIACISKQLCYPQWELPSISEPFCRTC